MSGLTWLHLSDWHQNGAEFNRKIIRDAIIRDINNRIRVDPNLAKIDFIIFSGDLSYSGEPVEFVAAQKHLLCPLLEAADLNPDRLFCVPGNHDINKLFVQDMLPIDLQKPFDSEFLVQKWLTSRPRRYRLLEPFEDYTKFVSDFTGQPTPDYASTIKLELGGKKIALVGLNSAWMCARGNESDYWHVVVGELQVQDALKSVQDADLRIAVLHHPVDWIAPFERNIIEAILERKCHFILHGHEHNTQIRIVNDILGDCITIPAGASYWRRGQQDISFISSYNYVHLDLDTGKGTVFLRKWNDQKEEWSSDTEASIDGQNKFEYLPRYLDKDKHSKLDSLISGQKIFKIVNAKKQLALEKQYRKLLLESISVFKLPDIIQEQFFEKEQKIFNFNSLYIPLRVCPYDILGKARNIAKQRKLPIGKILAPRKHLVILGSPGTGKSTLLRWIATTCLLRQKNVNLLQELPDASTSLI